MWFSGFFIYSVSHSWGVPTMKITDLSILCKWENLKNRQCIKYLFAPLYITRPRHFVIEARCVSSAERKIASDAYPHKTPLNIY